MYKKMVEQLKCYRTFVPKQHKMLINAAVVEWYFKCDYEGSVDDFDGVIIAEFNEEMKICDLKEFQSKSKHYFPYGE